MSEATFRKLTGILFIIIPIWLFANWTLLGQLVGVPEIQAQGVDALLTRYHEGGVGLIITWVIYFIPGLLFVVAIVMFHRVIAPENIPYMAVATTIGATSWILQFFGLVRWVFVYPFMADLWTDPSTTQTKKEAVEVAFQLINQYGGFALGQFVGISMTALWLLLIGFAFLKSPMFKPWMGWIAIVIAVGELIGNMASLGSVIDAIPFESLFAISAICWNIFYVWMVVAGVFILRWRPIGGF